MGIKEILIEWAKGHFVNGKSILMKTQGILVLKSIVTTISKRFSPPTERPGGVEMLYRNEELTKGMKTKTGTNQSPPDFATLRSSPAQTTTPRVWDEWRVAVLRKSEKNSAYLLWTICQARQDFTSLSWFGDNDHSV